MLIRYGDVSEQIRDYLVSDIEVLQFENPKKLDFERQFIKYFKKMEAYNEEMYKQILGLMLADGYKLLNAKRQDGFATKEEIKILEKYEQFDNEQAVLFLKINPAALFINFYSMSEFNDYDYFMKRSLLVDCRSKIDYLKKLSVYTVYDYLFYCQKYGVETLKTIFDDDMQEGYSEESSMLSLLNTINDLYVFDRKNYKELMSDLVTRYYLMGKNEIIKEDCSKYISYIEGHNPKDILDSLNDDDVMRNVLIENFHYNGDINTLKINSDEKVLKKIKKIEEI